MVLPESALETHREGPMLELVEGEVIFSRGTRLDDFNRMSRIRNPEVTKALNTFQPREVLTAAMNGLQLAPESDRRIVAEQIIDEAVTLQEIGSHIDQEFDPDRGLKRNLDEHEYETARFEKLSELVEGHSEEEQVLIERAAAALWYSDEIIEEAGYQDADLLRVLETIYQEADSFYSDTAREAYELGKISVAIEQGLID